MTLQLGAQLGQGAGQVSNLELRLTLQLADTLQREVPVALELCHNAPKVIRRELRVQGSARLGTLSRQG